jgi:UDP-2,4-diacetamido-2,4,6-trideoxy-beta-L-altropyranose hydrolase
MILLFRVDASTQIGTGHVMRCLALAQAWQEFGGEAHFATANLPKVLEERLTAENLTLHQLDVLPGSEEDAKQFAALAKELGGRRLVIDGYHFDSKYQKSLKNAGYNLLFWDDNGHANHYFADFVINQNIHAEPSLYLSREPYTQLLLGTKYAVLRKEFWSWRNWERAIPEKAKNILVTMGGSDPDNVTLRVIEALIDIQNEDLQVIVVVGGSNPHHASLQTAVVGSGDWIQLERNVSDMPALMAWADVAISAAGTTSWELLFMGLPALLVVLAENQERGASFLHKEGASINLGSGKNIISTTLAMNLSSLVVNRQLREDMSLKGTHLVDGYGVQRVIDIFSTTNQVESR